MLTLIKRIVFLGVLFAMCYGAFITIEEKHDMEVRKELKISETKVEMYAFAISNVPEDQRIKLVATMKDKFDNVEENDLMNILELEVVKVVSEKKSE